MSTRIGRIWDAVTIDAPQTWRRSADRQRITGWLNQTTTADRIAVAQELTQMALERQVVPVAITDNSIFDGYYRVIDCDVYLDAATRPDSTTGGYRFAMNLEPYGSAQAFKFESLVDGLLIANDYGVIESEAKYTWVPPQGAEAVGNAGSPSTGHTRTTPDGSVEVYIGVDPDLDPTWSCAPADFYSGAAYIELGGYKRVGLDAPEDLTSWKISTGVVDLFADGSNDGVVNLQHSVDQTPYGFQIKHDSSTAIPAWNYPSIIHNTGELCILSLTRDANDSPPTDNLHYLEITARRGFPLFYCRFVYSTATPTWTVDRESTDAATSVTPTGATGAMGIEDASDDGDGNRWFLASPNTTTKDTTNGGLDWSATDEIVFMPGIEIGGSGANASDDTGDVILQALAWLGESVKPQRR